MTEGKEGMINSESNLGDIINERPLNRNATTNTDGYLHQHVNGLVHIKEDI